MGTIAFTANEFITHPAYTTWQSVQSSDILERETGADIMLSPETYGVNTVGKLERHRDGGAVFLQLKRGADSLPNPDGLYQSIARMDNFGIPLLQRGLVNIGVYYADDNGLLCVNGPSPIGNSVPVLRGYQYVAWLSLQRHWVQMRGGNTFTVKEQYFERWCNDYVRDIVAALAQPTRTVFPDAISKLSTLTDVAGLIVPTVAPPTMQAFAGLPGVGKKFAEIAYNFYVVERGQSFIMAVFNMTYPAGMHFPGWGKGRAANLALALNVNHTAWEDVTNTLQPAKVVDNAD